jgi:hypothetical protein
MITMNREEKNLRQLAVQVSRGDTEAATEMQEHLNPLMARIIRRALRADSEKSALARRLKAGVNDVCNGSWAQLDRGQDQFPALVSRRVCNLVVDRLRSGEAAVAE